MIKGRINEAAGFLKDMSNSIAVESNNDIRKDLDEIRMAFEVLGEYFNNGYNELRRESDGTNEAIVGRIEEDTNMVKVYRLAHGDKRISARDVERKVSIDELTNNREANDEG